MSKNDNHRLVCPNPQCGNGRLGWFHRDYSMESHCSVWSCNNCGHEKPVTTRKSPIVQTMAGPMTAAQKKAIEQLTAGIWKNDTNSNPEAYTFLEYEVRLLEGGYVCLLTAVGTKKEGTIGRLFPTRRHIFITPNGGCTLMNPKKAWTHTDGTKFPAETRTKGVHNCCYALVEH